jgi:hypothetical protein
MNVKTQYGAKLEELLKKYQINKNIQSEESFFLFEELEQNSLLFIGINPSDAGNIAKKFAGIKREGSIYWGSKTFSNVYPYYQHFNDLASSMDWSHLDLFFSCEKNQKTVEKSYNNEFYNEQFKISSEIIHKLAPKIMVVSNALASHLIQDRFNCKFYGEIGTYRIKEYNNIPVFFSGMLTGGRALDVGSRERLKWHINFVKKVIGVLGAE